MESKKLKQMMALAASYAVNCHPCLEYHKRRAVEAGLSDEEMREALRVGEMVHKGANKFTRDKATTLFGEFLDAETVRAGSSACCS